MRVYYQHSFRFLRLPRPAFTTQPSTARRTMAFSVLLAIASFSAVVPAPVGALEPFTKFEGPRESLPKFLSDNLLAWEVRSVGAGVHRTPSLG